MVGQELHEYLASSRWWLLHKHQRKSRLDRDNSLCFTGFTIKAYRISLPLSFMGSYKSPEPRQKCSCGREAARRLPLTLTDVLQRQTAENSRIHLDQRPHLEKMSTERRGRERGDTVQQEGESHEYNEGAEDREGKGWARTKDRNPV